MAENIDDRYKAIRAPDLQQCNMHIARECNSGINIQSDILFDLFNNLYTSLLLRYFNELHSNPEFISLFESIDSHNKRVSGPSFWLFLYYFQSGYTHEYIFENHNEKILFELIQNTINHTIKIIRFVCELLPQRRNFILHSLHYVLSHHHIKQRGVLTRYKDILQSGTKLKDIKQAHRFFAHCITPTSQSVQDSIDTIINSYPLLKEDKPFAGETFDTQNGNSCRMVTTPYVKSIQGRVTLVPLGHGFSKKNDTKQKQSKSHNTKSTVILNRQCILTSLDTTEIDKKFTHEIKRINFNIIQSAIIDLIPRLQQKEVLIGIQKTSHFSVTTPEQSCENSEKSYLTLSQEHAKYIQKIKPKHSIFLFFALTNILKFISNQGIYKYLSDEQIKKYPSILKNIYKVNVYLMIFITYTKTSNHAEFYPKDTVIKMRITDMLNGKGDMKSIGVYITHKDRIFTINLGSGEHIIHENNADDMLLVLYSHLDCIQHAANVIAEFTNLLDETYTKKFMCVKKQKQGFG